MYWLGAAKPWGEGHNSFGVARPDTRWGLAEGRVGGPLNFHTFILLANPQSTAAEVTVTFLRENAAPIVKTYTVPPTSRFNVDSASVEGLKDESFGALITVTKGHWHHRRTLDVLGSGRRVVLRRHECDGHPVVGEAVDVNQRESVSQ